MNEKTSNPVETHDWASSTIDDAFIDWLSASATPTIRYLTLTRLLNFQPDVARVQAARQAIMRAEPVAPILTAQTAAGNWPNEHSYYTPKYTSTHWSLLLLSELDVDGADPGFRRGVDFMLADTAADVERRLTANTLDLACLWGNLLRYAVRAGRLTDPRTQAIIDLLLRSIHANGCQCVHNANLPCAWGVARSLWGLAAIPVADRSSAVHEALAAGVDFLLRRFSLAAADYPVPPGGKIHPLWFRLNFPLFYQVDILFVLRVLAELAALDRPQAGAALDWLAARRQRNGRWRGSSPYRARTWSCLGDREETNRWVSLQAATILKEANRLTVAAASADG